MLAATGFASWWLTRRKRAPLEAPTPPPEPQVDLHLRVQVLDRRDHPIADAIVTALGWGEGWWEEQEVATFGPVQTGKDGRAALQLPRAGSVRIRVEHPAFGVTARGVAVPSAPAVVVLRGGVEVEGRVYTASGPLAPVEAGRLEPAGGSRELRRDLHFQAPGIWRLGGVEPGTYLLYLDALAEPEVLVIPPVMATPVFHHELILPDLIEVVGRAVDPEGRPLAGWWVGAFPVGGEELSAEVETDADGGFELHLTRGKVYHFRLSDPDLQRPFIQSSAIADGTFLVLTGPKTAHLRGAVAFADPQCGGAITAHVGSRTYLVPSGGSSFQLDGLPAGAQIVWLESDNGISRPVELDLADLPVEPITFLLEPKVEWRGRIVDTDGHPRPTGHRLVLTPAGLSGPKREVALEADGSFAALALAPGPYNFSVRGPGWMPTIERRVELGAALAPPLWTLPSGVQVSGILELRGRPLPGAMIALRPLEPHAWGYEAGTETDASARFQLAGVPPGRYVLLHFSVEDGEGLGVILEVPPAGLQGIKVELEPPNGARLAIQLSPAPGRRYLLCLTAGHGTVPAGSAALRSHQVEPLIGRVVLSGLPPGPATLNVEAFEPGDAPGSSWSIPVDLVALEVTRVDLPTTPES